MMISDRQQQAQLREMERRVLDLERHVMAIPVTAGGGGGGGGGWIRSHDDFPPMPNKPTLISCKGQAWYAEQGYDNWEPAIGFTDEDGEPA